MGILNTIGDAIGNVVAPIIDKQLNAIRADAKTEIAAFRTEGLAMLQEALPEMAGAVAEQAIKTTFEHTQVDEAADAVSGVITDIVARLRLPFGGQR